MLSRRAASIEDSQTSATRTKARMLAAAGGDVVNLAGSEPDFDTSESIKRAAHRAIEAGCHRYTDGLGQPELRAAIAEAVSKETGVRYEPDECAVTAGAKQALFNAALMLFDAGDEVLIPKPCWGTFAAQVRLSGATPVFIDVAPSGYRLTADAVRAHLSDATRGIVLNTPNNPTGVVYRADELQRIAELSVERGFWIVADRCYSKLVYPPAAHHDVVALCPEAKRTAIIVDSLSKAFAVAGWRVGLLCAPKEVVRAVGRLQSHSTSNVSTISQRAALAAFTEDQTELLERARATLERRRSMIRSLLDGAVSFPTPEAAFYVFLDVGSRLGREFRGRPVRTVTEVADLLLEHFKVAVVPGSAFLSEVGLRISYVVDDRELAEGVRRLRAGLAAIH